MSARPQGLEVSPGSLGLGARMYLLSHSGQDVLAESQGLDVSAGSQGLEVSPGSLGLGARMYWLCHRNRNLDSSQYLCAIHYAYGMYICFNVGNQVPYNF